MNIQTPIRSNGADWLLKFGQAWSTQLTALKMEFGSGVQVVQVPGADLTDVPIVYVTIENLIAVLRYLKFQPGFGYNFLSDLTAIDSRDEDSRFEVVYNLFSTEHLWRIRVKVRVNDGTALPTAVGLWPGANWAEREAFDMFGIVFDGHPDLRRILNDSRFQGHPLRKDYYFRKYQIFNQAEPINTALLKDEDPKLYDGNGDEDYLDDSRQYLNIGPVHPAMHGAFRVVAKLDGEIIKNSYCELGFTHRGKEKLGEHRTYHQWIVYSDRLNYCSALINNVAYAMSVERLMGVEVPERCIWLRMICCELARIIDHLICVGINSVDSGAFTYFLYGFHQREQAYGLIEKLCGARLTTTYARIGGLMADAPEGWIGGLLAWIAQTRETLEEMDALLTNNRIWRNRTDGVGVFSKAQCLEYSFSGPLARAAGLDIDLRRDQPCMFYDEMKFEVPLGRDGDVYERYLVRVEEIRQSLRILEQCAARIKPGPIWSEDKRVRIPEKERVWNSMEAMIHHFMFFMDGFKVPPGEAYTQFEAANGELGFYIVSKGGPKAHRLRIRGPSFWHYQGLDQMIRGRFVADLVLTFGSLNIIAGEIDR